MVIDVMTLVPACYRRKKKLWLIPCWLLKLLKGLLELLKGEVASAHITKIDIQYGFDIFMIQYINRKVEITIDKCCTHKSFCHSFENYFQ